MNIVLTQEDADFVLKYIRADLEKLSDQLKINASQCAELRKKCSDKIKDEPLLQTLMGIADDLKKEVEEGAAVLQSGLERCAELLMCGSEVENETGSGQ